MPLNKQSAKFARMRKKVLILSAILLASACAPKVETRGYIKQANLKDEIVVGKTTKQEVLGKFGSPSTQSSFGAETWYYISSRKEAFGFMKPETTDQETFNISFDANGVVNSVSSNNKDDARDIDMVSRTTPTEGHSLSFIDQTIGNLGRFNKPGGEQTGHRPAGRGGF